MAELTLASLAKDIAALKAGHLRLVQRDHDFAESIELLEGYAGNVVISPADDAHRLVNVKDLEYLVTDPDDWGPAITAAITSAKASNYGGIYFPAKETPYRVKKQAGRTGSIEIKDVDGFEIRGEGPGSVIQMYGSGGGGTWQLFYIYGNVSNVWIHHLTIDGNWTNLTSLDPTGQTHTIQVGSSLSKRRTFTADAGTDTLTMTAHGYATGTGPVRVETPGGTLPTPLAVDTDYWIINTGANTFQYAASLADAQAGTEIPLDDAGTGTHTQIRTVTDYGYVRSLYLTNLTIDLPAGDGIRLVGGGLYGDDGEVSDALIAFCKITNGNRSGVSVQRSCQYVRMIGNYLSGAKNGDIDFEATGNTAIHDQPQYMNISLNHINHTTAADAVALGGMDGVKPAISLSFTDNMVIGGSVFIIDVDGLVFERNTIIGTTLVTAGKPNGGPELTLRGLIERAYVGRNIIERVDAAHNQPVMYAFEECNGLHIDHNWIKQVAEDEILHVDNASNLKVTHNDLDYTGAGTVVTALRLQTDAGINASRIRAHHNTIRNLGAGAITNGIQLVGSATGTVRQIAMNDNEFADVDLWIVFNGSTTIFPEPITAIGNRGDTGIPFAKNGGSETLNTIVALLIGGNFGSQALYTGDGAPTFSAAKASLYLRRDGTVGAGGAAGTLRYVNSTGSTTWVALADAP